MYLSDIQIMCVLLDFNGNFLEIRFPTCYGYYFQVPIMQHGSDLD